MLLATARGYGITFSEEEVRSMGRGARGVRGISLRPGDRVVGAVPLEENKHLVLVSSGGWGKDWTTPCFLASTEEEKG